MKKTDYYVISHTRWNREGVLPFQKTRWAWVHLVDDLLEIFEKERSFKHFHLDGQAIILEDYLEIRPEKEEIVCKWVKQGRRIRKADSLCSSALDRWRVRPKPSIG